MAGGPGSGTRSTTICNSAWPGGSKGKTEVGGGYQNLDDVLHHLRGCSGEEAP